MTFAIPHLLAPSLLTTLPPRYCALQRQRLIRYCNFPSQTDMPCQTGNRVLRTPGTGVMNAVLFELRKGATSCVQSSALH